MTLLSLPNCIWLPCDVLPMGQACPQSSAAHQYTPTKCQGVSTAESDEKYKVETSQPAGMSKVTSRGASCTQEDIRRSLRREKDNDSSPPKATSRALNNKDSKHSKYTHGSKTAAHQNQDSWNDDNQNCHKTEKRGNNGVREKRHRHHRHQCEHSEKVSLVVQQDWNHATDRQHIKVRQYRHKTHEINYKNMKQYTSKTLEKRPDCQEGPSLSHHRHQSTSHQLQRDSQEVRKHRYIEKGQLSLTHIEYSSQNEHNAKLSAKKAQLPNGSHIVSSSDRHNEKAVNERAVSPRSSMRGKMVWSKDRQTCVRSRKVEDPVYTLPPLVT